MQQQPISGQPVYVPHHARPAPPPLDGQARMALECACNAAAHAAETMAGVPAGPRAQLLDAIAARLDGERAVIRRLAMADTGCSGTAVDAEHASALAQLAAFAAVLRAPATGSDGATRSVALGAVAALGNGCLTPIYAAAGSQAVAALAAGCAVVTLRHHLHARCSALIGQLVQGALADCGLPAGLYQMLDDAPGSADMLLAHPAIRGVLYDGSRADGLRYQHAVLERADPIPLLGQLPGSNPVFILPGALNARAEHLGQQLLRQFMPLHQPHKTSLVVAVDGPGFLDLREGIMDAVSAMPPVPMANYSISCYHRGSVERLLNDAQVGLLAEGAAPDDAPAGVRAMFAEAEAGALLASPQLAEAHPGPAALLLRCTDAGQLLGVARALRRQPLATLHLCDSDGGDLALAARLLPLLERIAAQVGVNSFCAAPCPSPAAAAEAIARLQRPVFFQFPEPINKTLQGLIRYQARPASTI
jgi:alpha-ketoglutaric semialdehyde dehydrogenase